MPVEHNQDPWTRIRSRSDFPADELISQFQKAIRRSDVENAARIADECYRTSAEFEEKLWTRVMVSSVEDVGMARTDAVVIVEALDRARQRFAWPEHDRFLFLLHATRVLAQSPKDRSTDDLANLVKLTADDGERPVIHDYALDVHTRRGQEMGRDITHFLAESSKVEPDVTVDRQWGIELRRRLLES